MNSLPLSWSIINTDSDNSTIINKWNIKWLALQNLPTAKLSFQFKKEFESNSETIIRGCNSNLTEDLTNYGYSSIQIGMEAVLDTDKNHFEKKSLRELIRRGKRHGKIVNLPFSKQNISRLKEFQKLSSHSKEPQLKNLFQSEFNKQNILYVFEDNDKNWLGAILVSRNTPDKLHTELILRKTESPIGIMEALVQHVFYEAKANNIKQLSLGEVPFSYDNLGFDNAKSFFVIKIGRLLKFAYNYKGLYNFKNKFQPKWEQLFICTSSKTSLKHLFFLAINSNFHKLIFHKLLHSIKKNYASRLINRVHIFILKPLDFNKT
jgi:glycosyltransferase 2 family protein